MKKLHPNFDRVNHAFIDLEIMDVIVGKVISNHRQSMAWTEEQGGDKDHLWGADIANNNDVPRGYVVVKGQDEYEYKSICRLKGSGPSLKMSRDGFLMAVQRLENDYGLPFDRAMGLIRVLSFSFDDDDGFIKRNERFAESDPPRVLRDFIIDRIVESASGPPGSLPVATSWHVRRTLDRKWWPFSVDRFFPKKDEK
jgi:hypothetical protein